MNEPVAWLDISGLAAVTVTFNPDQDILRQQLGALAHVRWVVMVDNGSSAHAVQALRLLAAGDARITLVEQATNTGLAAALNVGIDTARSCGATSLLLLDQDSTFAPEAPARLLDGLNRMQRESGRLCCVGPALQDPQTGMCHGFHHEAGGWRWARSFPPPEAPPLAVDNLNGSGTTMASTMVDHVGLFEASLFIDHVDTEWSFRVLSRGGRLYGLPGIVFDHRMGERGRRIWLLGWRVWPERSPLRHYYLFRNTVRLLRRSYVSRVWRAWAVGKMLATAAIVGCTDPRRRQQLGMMWGGLRDGLRRGDHG